jgi:hypothetical protein
MQPIKLIDIHEPISSIDNGICKMTQKMVALCAEDIENFVAESIIKALPDDVTKVLLIDKKKLAEIFEKQMPIEICMSHCQCGEIIDKGWKYCPNCGQRLEVVK